MHIALLRRAKQTHFDPQTKTIFFRMIALIVYWAWSSTEFDTQKKNQLLSLCSTQADSGGKTAFGQWRFRARHHCEKCRSMWGENEEDSLKIDHWRSPKITCEALPLAKFAEKSGFSVHSWFYLKLGRVKHEKAIYYIHLVSRGSEFGMWRRPSNMMLVLPCLFGVDW